MLRNLVRSSRARRGWARGAASILVPAVVVLLDGAMASAQTTSEQWPTNTGSFPATPLDFTYGPGMYLSLLKIGLFWLVFLGWVQMADWVNRDAQEHKAQPAKWNPIIVFPFIAAVILLWMLPWFWLTWPLLIVAAILPAFFYARARNSTMPSEEHIFTQQHLRVVLAEKLRPLGIKIAVEPRAKQVEPPVKLSARGGANDREDQANEIKARASSGHTPTLDMIFAAIQQRVGTIMLDYTKDAVAVRNNIDGQWVDAGTKDRKTGDAILEVMKTLANLKPEERVAKQRGAFAAQHEKTRYTCRLVSQGTKTGERALVTLDTGGMAKAKLSDLGMKPAMEEKLKAVLGEKRGFVVVSAPPAGGLTTLMNATVTAVDRFMRSAVGIEDSGNPDLTVENVPITTFNGAAGENASTVLQQVIRQYPDVFIVPELSDAATVSTLCEQVVDEERLVVGSIRAKEAPETLLRVLMLKVPLKQFVPAVTGVVNGRLVRRLCEACKESYPTPETTAKQLAQLGAPAEQLFRPRQPPGPDVKKPPPPCSECQGIGYKGRIGIFELLVVDDNVRQALLKQPTIDSVRQAARKAGWKSLQEEGVHLVSQGVTSLQELMRALKE